jgi:hypothetical protein
LENHSKIKKKEEKNIIIFEKILNFNNYLKYIQEYKKTIRNRKRFLLEEKTELQSKEFLRKLNKILENIFQQAYDFFFSRNVKSIYKFDFFFNFRKYPKIFLHNIVQMKFLKPTGQLRVIILTIFTKFSLIFTKFSLNFHNFTDFF